MAEENWTTIIKARNNLLDINLKEIWQYKDLYTLFVKRNIITQYKQTILGPLWFFIQPVLTTVMYMVVLVALLKLVLTVCRNLYFIFPVLFAGSIFPVV